MSEFKLTIAQIYDLTPRQIEEVYFHDRDKDGNVKAPSMGNPIDPVAKLTQLLGMAQAGAVKLKPDDLERLKARIEAERDGNQSG